MIDFIGLIAAVLLIIGAYIVLRVVGGKSG